MKNKPLMTVYGDGIHDDWEALQAFHDGKADLIHADGTLFINDRNMITGNYGGQGKKYFLSKTLTLGRYQ